MARSTNTVCLCIFQASWHQPDAPNLTAPGAFAQALAARLAPLGGVLVCEQQPQPDVRVWRRRFPRTRRTVRVTALIRLTAEAAARGATTDDLFSAAFVLAATSCGVPSDALRPERSGGPLPYAYAEQPFDVGDTVAAAAAAATALGDRPLDPDQPAFHRPRWARLVAHAPRPGEPGFVAVSCAAPEPGMATPTPLTLSAPPATSAVAATDPASTAAATSAPAEVDPLTASTDPASDPAAAPVTTAAATAAVSTATAVALPSDPQPSLAALAPSLLASAPAPVSDVATGAASAAPAPAGVLQAPTAAARASGRAFIASLQGLRGEQARDQAILAAVGAGAMPSYMRGWVDVDMSGPDARGTRHTATIRVKSDYLAVGNDGDFVYVPLFPASAQRVATALGGLLPTKKIVKAIWVQAAIRYRPRSFAPRPGAGRDSITAVIEQNQAVANERAGRNPALLSASAKKDIVISPGLARHPGMMAIWGWVKADGTPVQGLFFGHSRGYRDYSHGVRVVSSRMVLDGRPVNTADVLRDPVLATLLSDEGRINNPSY